MYKALQQSPGEIDSKPENKTGIPTQLKQQMEQYSGLSLDSVRVHYSSAKPAQLQAYAYTQGNEVYIAPGQEKHLQHELGHVIQQRQRQIPPTVYRNGAAINLDAALEREADSYGRLSLGSLSGNSYIEKKSPYGQPAVQLSPHAKFWKYFYVGGVELSKTQLGFWAQWNEGLVWEIPSEALELKEMAARTWENGEADTEMLLEYLQEQLALLQQRENQLDPVLIKRIDKLEDEIRKLGDDGDKPSSSTKPSSATPSSSSVPSMSSSSSTSEAPPSPVTTAPTPSMSSSSSTSKAPPSSATHESTLAPAEASAASSRPVVYNLPLMVYETFGGDSSKLLHIFNQTLQYPGLSICVIGINRKIINTSNSEPDIKALAVDVDDLRKNIATRISSRHMAILAPFVWKSAADHYYDFPYYEVRSRLMEIADQETDTVKHVLYRWIDGDARDDTTAKLSTKLLAGLAATPTPMLLSGVYNWRLDEAIPPEIKDPSKIVKRFFLIIPKMVGLLIINQLENYLRLKIFESLKVNRGFLIIAQGKKSGSYYLPESTLMMNRSAHLAGIGNLRALLESHAGRRTESVQDKESAVGFPVDKFPTVIDARLSVTKPNKIDSMGRQYVPLSGDGSLGVPFSRVRQTALDTGHFSAVAGITPSSAFGPGTMTLLVRDMIEAGKEELIMRLMEMVSPYTRVNPDAMKKSYDELAAEVILVKRIEEDFAIERSKIQDTKSASASTSASESASALKTFVDKIVYGFLMKVLMPPLIEVMIQTVGRAHLKPSPKATLSPVLYARPGIFNSTDPAGRLLRDIAQSGAPSHSADFWNDNDL